eukprot:1461088-Ditylum_brightwellii.AAC.1
MGFAPKRVIADFDMKLISGAMKDFFTKKETIVEGAPPPHTHHQQQNSLVERHWHTLLRMAHCWINSALLPSLFWFVALERAVTVHNYLPFQLRGQLTTPFELVHHE